MANIKVDIIKTDIKKFWSLKVVYSLIKSSKHQKEALSNIDP